MKWPGRPTASTDTGGTNAAPASGMDARALPADGPSALTRLYLTPEHRRAVLAALAGITATQLTAWIRQHLPAGAP